LQVSRSADFLAAFRPRIPHAAVLGFAIALMDTLRSFPIFMSDPTAGDISRFLLNLAIADCLSAAFMIAAITWAERVVVRPGLRFPLIATTVVVASFLTTLVVKLGWGIFLQKQVETYETSVWMSIGLYQFWMGCATGALAAFYYEFWERATQSTARLRDAELARQGIEQRVVESRLSVMKARIEPAFLFNSIATVQKLYRGNADAAEKLLDDLIVYLRAALPQMRGKTSSLGDEIHLVASYLKLHDDAFAGRLAVTFDVPEDARELTFPPMVLLPLVEDAVHRAQAMSHPALAIVVAVTADATALRVGVMDDCPLTRLDVGTEASLKSQASSLAAFFGDAARLTRGAGEAGGTRITFEIPRRP